MTQPKPTICHLTIEAVVGSDGRFYVETADGHRVVINSNIILIDYDAAEPRESIELDRFQED